MKLKNATGATSRIGLTVSLDPRNPSAFVYSSANPTDVIGIVGQEVPKDAMCEIITSGTARVMVADKVVQGSIIRAQKSTDNISRGFCKFAQSTDTPYFEIGTALESGRGLVRCNLKLSGGSASVGYVPYTGATGDVNLGSYEIYAAEIHTNDILQENGDALLTEANHLLIL